MGYMSEIERNRRSNIMADAKSALANNLTIEAHEHARAERAADHARYFNDRLDREGGDVLKYLPDALARLELKLEGQITEAVREIKTTLIEALKK
jgi:hypothetical protein